MKQRLFAEFFGTFCLVFAGTGAIVVNQMSDGVVTHVGVALTFGLIVMAMIYALGDVSGAHLNPAVSIAFALAKRFAWGDVWKYGIAQLLGALAASGFVMVFAPSESRLGATMPSIGAIQACVVECVLTLILMIVILSVSHGAKERGLMAGVAVGGVVGLEAMFAGPITGASMNPVRSLAPAIVSGDLAHQWVYIVGPVLGAAAGVMVDRLIHPPRPTHLTAA